MGRGTNDDRRAGAPGANVRDAEGESLFVASEGGERGSAALFYPVYRADGARYGWRCGNCGSLDVGMDTMGRVKCQACRNERKPRQWDAAYL